MIDHDERRLVLVQNKMFIALVVDPLHATTERLYIGRRSANSHGPLKEETYEDEWKDTDSDDGFCFDVCEILVDDALSFCFRIGVFLNAFIILVDIFRYRCRVAFHVFS